MVNASGGTGKTLLLNSIISFLKLQFKNVIVVSSSDVAAILLIDAATPHSTFKIPLDISNVNMQRSLRIKVSYKHIRS